AHALEIATAFLATVKDEKQTERARLAAASEYIDFRRTDKEGADEILGLITPRTSPELSRGLLEALGRSEVAGVGSAIIRHLGSGTPTARGEAVRVLLSRVDWTRPLLDALETGKVQPAELSLDQKQALSTSTDRPVRERARAIFARTGGLPDADRQKVLD